MVEVAFLIGAVDAGAMMTVGATVWTVAHELDSVAVTLVIDRPWARTSEPVNSSTYPRADANTREALAVQNSAGLGSGSPALRLGAASVARQRFLLSAGVPATEFIGARSPANSGAVFASFGASLTPGYHLSDYGAQMKAKDAIDGEIQAAIDTYLKARTALRALGDRHPDRFGGNDNLIGRVGEFMALRYFERQGRKPKKVGGGKHSTKPGFDLVEGGARVQVKVITHENKRGRSTRLRRPWTELLLIELGQDYQHSRIGHLRAKNHGIARKADRRLSKNPVVRRSMLEANGLIGLYGEVTRGDNPP